MNIWYVVINVLDLSVWKRELIGINYNLGYEVEFLGSFIIEWKGMFDEEIKVDIYFY